MARARFYSIEWSCRESLKVELNNRKLKWKKNQYILTVETECGDKYSEDIYGVIKYFSNNRLTKKWRKSFEEYLQEQEFCVGVHENISNLYQIVERFCLS